MPRSTTASPTKRADARRNVEAILDSAERCLARDPDASMTEIAAEAGLGRVTIYGHFPTRAALIESVARRVLDEANTVLAQVDLSGDPEVALARLVVATWEVTARSSSLVVAAERALPPRVVRDAHTRGYEDRVRRLLRRGQRSGVFRSDLSMDWLVATFHSTIHNAATEIEAGRLRSEDAAGVITATLLGVFRPHVRA